MKEKKRFWELVLEHPIATIIIIVVLSNCIVNIINAVKGNEIVPVFNVKVDLAQASGEKLIK